MLRDRKAFSGFAVKNLDDEEQFLSEVLGLDVERQEMGLQLNIAGSTPIFIYEKQDVEPSNYTILNFPVEDIDATVDELAARGVVFERYEGFPFDQDEKGIARGKAAGIGPDIAWFKDPSGNTLSVLSE